MATPQSNLAQEVLDRRKTYVDLTKEYDDLLSEAHRLPHGTAEQAKVLKEAGAIGPAMLQALKQYQAAIAAWAESIATEPKPRL